MMGGPSLSCLSQITTQVVSTLETCSRTRSTRGNVIDRMSCGGLFAGQRWSNALCPQHSPLRRRHIPRGCSDLRRLTAPFRSREQPHSSVIGAVCMTFGVSALRTVLFAKGTAEHQADGRHDHWVAAPATWRDEHCRRRANVRTCPQPHAGAPQSSNRSPSASPAKARPQIPRACEAASYCDPRLVGRLPSTGSWPRRRTELQYSSRETMIPCSQCLGSHTRGSTVSNTDGDLSWLS